MLFINREVGFQQLAKFQVAFLLPVLFTFAPHAGAGTFFSLLRQRKESKRKATAGTGLALPNFPHFARFFGRARNLRLRRFEHASPYSPKNRASFGCASRKGTTAAIDVENSVFGYERSIGKRGRTLVLIFQVACLLRKTAQSVYPSAIKICLALFYQKRML